VGQRPTELTPHASPRHFWGAELRARRERQGKSLAALAREVHCDASYLAKIERAERPAPEALVRQLDHAARAEGTLIRLWELIDAGQGQQVIMAATTAQDVANSRGHVANGAVDVVPVQRSQAPLETGDDVVVPARTSDGRIIFVAVSRRHFLSGLGAGVVAGIAGPSSANVAPVALPNHDVNPLAHFKQMRRVLIDSDNILGARRVLPTVQEQIKVMQRLRQNSRGVDHQELLGLQTQYAELAGWLSQDLGDHQAAVYWTDRALTWSHQARDPDLSTYVMARKSQLAGDMRDTMEAIDTADAARHMAQPGSRLAAVAATYSAHGHALAGDLVASERSYEDALRLLDEVQPNPGSSWGVWLDPAYIAVQRARSLAELGQHEQAAEGFRVAIAALPEGYRRDQGVYLARQALAVAGTRDAEQAATLGLHALAIGTDTGSGRILSELARLDNSLARWAAVPEVATFRQAMSDVVAIERA
jgi:tetratricopeptide (TPR) repeat protein